MNDEKKALLEAQGWKVGDAAGFLGLTNEEQAYIAIKIALSRKVRAVRNDRRLTQEETAKLIGSSQSRIAKLEAGDPSVSIDLQMKSLLALGVTREELGQTIAAALPLSA